MMAAHSSVVPSVVVTVFARQMNSVMTATSSTVMAVRNSVILRCVAMALCSTANSVTTVTTIHMMVVTTTVGYQFLVAVTAF